MTIRSYPKGSIIWHQGDPSRFVLRILTGTVNIVGQSEDGHDLVLRSAKAKEYLGEMSALEGERHSATLVAGSDCQVELIPADHFRQRLHRDTELALKLLRQQNQRVRTLSETRVESTYKPVKIRLALHLLRRFEQEGSTLRCTHEALARELGTTRESITKSLKQIALSGAVSLHRGRIQLRDPESLSRVLL